jgi:hypothetical protein
MFGCMNYWIGKGLRRTKINSCDSLNYFSVYRSLHKDFDDESGIMLTKGPSMKKFGYMSLTKGSCIRSKIGRKLSRLQFGVSEGARYSM